MSTPKNKTINEESRRHSTTSQEDDCEIEEEERKNCPQGRSESRDGHAFRTLDNSISSLTFRPLAMESLQTGVTTLASQNEILTPIYNKIVMYSDDEQYSTCLDLKECGKVKKSMLLPDLRSFFASLSFQ
jgi:hypothetical protein